MMSDKTQYQLTQEQAEKAIKMCLDNAWSYLNDADMYVSNNRTEHLAIQLNLYWKRLGRQKSFMIKKRSMSQKFQYHIEMVSMIIP